ncbi:nuclear transport factor 2 family protein [Mycolicibacterium sp. CBMA 226]|uniref:nuclear transport factor 2 family protein n=1 Tax=Mycolicibacterium sp. CBMA 226 TaxID=2606611 RepID=UPI0012DE75BC|nr:nuclear transport factor 2 family protein [Mycolicibacterium sp. CBMA 226]MUL74510.1 nuclear transport factor 2 family protein [Mycolicibacterium sp. CBMA 226]
MTTKTLASMEKRLQALEDREAIRELLSSFCRAVDGKDRSLFVSLWETDARWEVGPPAGFAEGHDALLANVERVWTVLPDSYHMLGNFLIEVDGDRARLTCDVNVRGTDVGDRAILAGGTYSDDLHRGQDGRWRIVEHVANVHYWAPVNDPWSLDPASRMKLPITS